MSNQQLHLLQWIEYGKCMKMLVNGNLSGMVYLKKFSVVGRTGVFFRAWAVSIKNLCWLMRSSRDLLPINTLWWSNIASCEIPELNGGKTFVRGGFLLLTINNRDTRTYWPTRYNQYNVWMGLEYFAWLVCKRVGTWMEVIWKAQL